MCEYYVQCHINQDEMWRPVATERAETQHYLQQLYRTGFLADIPDPVGEIVHDNNLLPTRLDLLPVHLQGKLHVFLNEFLGQFPLHQVVI